MDEHLGYPKYNHSNVDNVRNGYNRKNPITENGSIDLEVPHDRNSDFEPVIVSKRQTRMMV